MPYTDMLLIASTLDNALPDKPSQSDIAHALAALAATPLGERSDLAVTEDEVLRRVFSRVRNIQIVKLRKGESHGWEIRLTGRDGANVVGTDLKKTINDLLDVVAATAALKG